MSRKGTKTITLSEEDHDIVKDAASKMGVGIADCVVCSVEAVASGDLGEVNSGIDVELILIDLAETKKRVSELEDEIYFIMKFLKARFPGHASKLAKLINAKSENTPITPVDQSIFGQEDTGLSTEEAIRNCMIAIPVTVDPILKKIGISSKDLSTKN